MDRVIITICGMQYVMDRANAIRDMQIRYGPRKCDMRYAICQYAMGRANAIGDMQIRYGPRECNMQ